VREEAEIKQMLLRYAEFAKTCELNDELRGEILALEYVLGERDDLF